MTGCSLRICKLSTLWDFWTQGSAIRLEAERSRQGYQQDERQRRLAETLVADAHAADELLESGTDSEAFQAALASEQLLRYILALFLDYWATGQGDPVVELAELTGAFGERGCDVWEGIRPRGVDALVFGSRARRRLLNRVSDHLSQGGSPRYGRFIQ